MTNTYNEGVEYDFSYICDKNNLKIKIVVLDEHTIGVIYPNIPDTICPLHCSVLKGSPYSLSSRIQISDKIPHMVRYANHKDFDDFRIVADGYYKDNNYYFDRTL